jgi:hypothetical protein
MRSVDHRFRRLGGKFYRGHEKRHPVPRGYRAPDWTHFAEYHRAGARAMASTAQGSEASTAPRPGGCQPPQAACSLSAGAANSSRQRGDFEGNSRDRPSRDGRNPSFSLSTRPTYRLRGRAFPSSVGLTGAGGAVEPDCSIGWTRRHGPVASRSLHAVSVPLHS